MNNILFYTIFFIIFSFSVYSFFKAVLSKFKLIFAGRDAEGTEDFRKYKNLKFRLKTFFENVILQKKLFKHPVRGVAHALVFYGFLLYVAHTGNQIFVGLFGYFFTENPYSFNLIEIIFSSSFSHFYESFLQVVSILVLIALGIFSWRRWVKRAKGLDFKSPESVVVISMISILMLSTLLGEAVKVVSSYKSATSPFIIADILSVIFSSLNSSSADVVYAIFWWIHILAVFAFMVYVPNSKHAHLIYAPFNYFFKSDTPKGALSKMDLEDENAAWGANKIEDFPWPNLLDGLACIECGRCQVVCPANQTGKVLNPKTIITGLKHALIEKMPEVQQVKNNVPVEEQYDKLQSLDTNVIDVYEGLSTEALWGCTTCFACADACPVGNNQVDAIIGMRRHLVLSEANFPSELQTTFNNMENNSNPWGIGSHKRMEWAEGLDVKTMAEKPDAEVLYWVGCAGAFDDKNKKITRDIVNIFNEANVNFGVLGTEENCTGDSARRAGNEYLFQTLAQTNVETFNKYNVKKIVTACPHCFNTIKNEYSQFGGNYEVTHHSEFIHNLVKEKKVKLKKNIDIKEKYTYHDSCYLGRHNDKYEDARQILKEINGEIPKEPVDTKENGLCCGAGGAQMWMEEQNDDRVNNKRAKQLIDTNSTTIATACPFCITMISDGVKATDENSKVQVKDIAEITAEHLLKEN